MYFLLITNILQCMNSISIGLCIADAKEFKQIKYLIQQKSVFNLLFTVTDGRALIEKLKTAKKLPELILYDALQPCCDGLLLTTICKKMFNNIQLVPLILSSKIQDIGLIDLLNEGANGILTKFMLHDDGAFFYLYNNQTIFTDSLVSIAEQEKIILDPLLPNINSLQQHQPIKQINKRLPPHLNDNLLLYLLLYAAGYKRSEIATLMVKSESTVKYYIGLLLKMFNAKRNSDLLGIAVSSGIVKYLKLYR